MGVERRTKVVRTEDGVGFGVETDERYISAYGEESARLSEIGRAIDSVIDAALSGLRRSRPSHANIEFGLEFDSTGTVFIPRGLETAHVVIRADYGDLVGRAEIERG